LINLVVKKEQGQIAPYSPQVVLTNN